MDNFISRLKNLSTRLNGSEPSLNGALNSRTIDSKSADSTDRSEQGGKSAADHRAVRKRRQQLAQQLQRRQAAGEVGSNKSFRLPVQKALNRLGKAIAPVSRFYQRQPRHRQVLIWLALLATGGGSVLMSSYWSLEQTLPNTADIASFARDGTMTIKAADGSVLQQLGPATRQKLSLDKIPDRVVNAFIAAEDRRFYQHHGIDLVSIVRAVSTNLMAGDVVEGGSTITQQLARVVYLNQDRTMWRKVQEALMAQKIERELSKDRILEKYLNYVYLGSSAYGVADAAWIYFSKPVDKLTLSEAATIAGLPPAPSEFSPLVNKKAAQERRDIVLERMQEQGYITAAEAEAASAEPLKLKPSAPKNFYSETPYFTSYVQQELRNLVSKEQLELGGLTVETTLNPRWQKRADDVIRDAVNEIGPAEGFEQAALVSIDPRTGEIRAMVGGTDFRNSQFNRATQAQRQPGSSFKTILYTAAIATGMAPTDGYLDAPFKVDGYRPQNYSRKYSGWMSLKEALTNSINVVSVKLIIDVGFDPVIQVARNMGIKSKLLPAYSLALGSSEVNLLELTSAYGTLANKGKHVEAHGIRRILNRKGKVIYDANYTWKPAVDPGTAAIIAWMMQGVVNSGTGQAAQLPDRPVAGKTGTSEEYRDLWFVGFVPQLVTGIWLGNDDNYPTGSASSTAAHVWHKFMINAIRGMPVENFPEMPDFYTRKGSIKAKPVSSPGSISHSAAPDEGSDSSGSSSGASQPYDSGGSYGGGSGYSDGYSGGSGSYDGGGQGSDREAPAEQSTPASEPPPPAPADPAAPAPAELPPPAESAAPTAPAEPAPPASSSGAPPAPAAGN